MISHFAIEQTPRNKLGADRSRFCQQANVKDFLRGELFEEGLWHGCNRNRIADGVEDLDRITHLPSVGGMTIDNSCDVSTLQFFFWNVSSQGDLLKQFELHGHLPLSATSRSSRERNRRSPGVSTWTSVLFPVWRAPVTTTAGMTHSRWVSDDWTWRGRAFVFIS